MTTYIGEMSRQINIKWNTDGVVFNGAVLPQSLDVKISVPDIDKQKIYAAFQDYDPNEFQDKPYPAFAGTGPENGFFCPQCVHIELKVIAHPRWGEAPLHCSGCEGTWFPKEATARNVKLTETEAKFNSVLKNTFQILSDTIEEFSVNVERESVSALEGGSRRERRALKSAKKKGTGKVPTWIS